MKRMLLALIMVATIIVPAMAWYQGYNYQQAVYINGTTIAQTNYPMNFTVINSTGTSSGTVLYLNNHSLNWSGTVLSDIRFTDSSNNTLLQLQDHEHSTSASARYLVSIPSIPFGSTNGTLIYVYYGNASSPQKTDSSTVDIYDTFTDAGISFGTPFQKSASNPLFASNSREPSVYRNGTTSYWLYYDDSTSSILFRDCTNEVTCGAASTALSSALYGSVWKDGSIWRMVYTKTDLTEIRLANSTDGKTFTDRGTLVTLGGTGANDSYAVADPSEIKVGSTYYLYYSAFPQAGGVNVTVALAESSTGAPGSYTKYGKVLDKTSLDWDAVSVNDPFVESYDTGKYILWYSGYDGLKQYVGYATSTDLHAWTKSADNPMAWPTQSWETESKIREAKGIIESSTYKMWFSDDATRIGYLTFPQDPTTKLPVKNASGVWNNNYQGGTTWTSNYGNLSIASTDATGHLMYSVKNVTHQSLIEYRMVYPSALYFIGLTHGASDSKSPAMGHTNKVNFENAVGVKTSTWYCPDRTVNHPSTTGTDMGTAYTGLYYDFSLVEENSTSNYALRNGTRFDYISTPVFVGNVYVDDYGDATNTRANISQVIVRKYYSPEPVFGPWGSEATASPITLNASFTDVPDPSSTGQSVTFTDTSEGSPTTWNWTISGIGITNTTQNMAYTFSTAGTYYVDLNITNATGSFANFTSTHTVVNASGFTPQDVWMEGQYLQTFTITDSETGMPITAVTLILSPGGSTYTTTNGTGYLTTGFGIYTVTFVSNGYNGKTISYAFDSDQTHAVQLTPANPGGSQNVWYTPWQVRIRIVDYYGKPLPDTNVTAFYIASTLPNTNTTWLTSAYGISPEVATDMVNSAKAMDGRTDDNGGLSFTMFKSLEYHLEIVNSTSGVSATKNLYPSDPEYVIYVRTAGQTAANNTLGLRNGTLPWYSLNSTHISLNMSYIDGTLCTGNVTFRVWFRNNGSELHNNTQSAATGTQITDSHIVLKAPIGTEYLWGYNATTNC